MALSTENRPCTSRSVCSPSSAAPCSCRTRRTRPKRRPTRKSGQAAQLPKIELSDDDLKKIEKIELTKPAGDAGAGVTVELTKKR